jgi:uncharacterized protein (TIGR03435 family)
MSHNTRQSALSTGIAAVMCAAAFGQGAERLTFEVVSVRPSALPDPGGLWKSRGGPGTLDPGQITWSNAKLMTILTTAFDVKPYQISGPAWLDTERYDIVAKVPEGATIEQVRVMWRNLLAERFGMLLHHESKEFQVDEVVVSKGGPKFKETSLDPNAPRAVETGKLDGNGAPEINGPGLIKTIQAGANGPVGHVVARAQVLSPLLTILEDQLHHPVVDKTGLTGRYDYALEYTPDLAEVRLQPRAAPGGPGTEASEPGSNLAAAIQQQLGLRLVSGKAKLDVVVVDKAEKTPTEN